MREEVFHLADFDKYREDNRREVKRAQGGLPDSLWDTYSAFANSSGGVIILGVKENKDGSWYTTGLKDSVKLRKAFWDTINNRQKISVNLLRDDDVSTYKLGDDVIMVIYVPHAKREDKPVYINNDMFNGSFKRNWEGDYHCTSAQVKSMLRDQAEMTMDMQVLDEFSVEDLNKDTVHGYRNRHRFLSVGHPFEKLDDGEYLRAIGAAAISDVDKQLHPTAAGLLMFGNEYDIVRRFPDYFLDYREEMDSSVRWTHRIQSSSGDWSGNLCDFYYHVYNRLSQYVEVPFKTVNGIRVDDTSVHEALREALANCLINADYYGVRGIVIRRNADSLLMENPGYSRTGIAQMRLGGISDPRNKALMKMFNLLKIGERAGSGVPSILDVWQQHGWQEPEFTENSNPDRFSVKLAMIQKDDTETDANDTDSDTDKNSSDTENDTENDTEKIVSDTEYRLLELIMINPGQTIDSFAKNLQLSAITVKRCLKSLKDKGIIQRIGSDRKGYWRIERGI